MDENSGRRLKVPVQEKSAAKMWEEYRSFWLNAIEELKAQGLITDELMRMAREKKRRRKRTS